MWQIRFCESKYYTWHAVIRVLCCGFSKLWLKNTVGFRSKTLFPNFHKSCISKCPMVLISQRFAMRSKSNGRVFLSFFVKTAGPVICRMLSYAPTRRALVVGCGLQMFQQLSGINTIMYVSLSACSWKVCAGCASQGRQERVLHGLSLLSAEECPLGMSYDC